VAVRPLRLANARSGLSELDVEEPVVSKAKGRVESRAQSANGGKRTQKENVFKSVRIPLLASQSDAPSGRTAGSKRTLICASR